jgi:hypothetical protein
MATGTHLKHVLPATASCSGNNKLERLLFREVHLQARKMRALIEKGWDSNGEGTNNNNNPPDLNKLKRTAGTGTGTVTATANTPTKPA